VNAVTLRLLRHTEADVESLRALTPVVRYSVSVAPAAKNNEELYWQTATKLELATADCDWKAAEQHQKALLAVSVEPWMLESTVDNLKRQMKAFGRDAVAKKQLDKLIIDLTGP
jgi:hypothetical protein